MLEYEYKNIWEDDDAYNYAFEMGYVSSMLDYIKLRYKDYCKKTDDKDESLRIPFGRYPKDMAEYLIGFMDRYYGMSEKSILKRFVSESEFLPWRL